MNKALFLDRDGIINMDTAYVSRVEDFYFLDGIFDLCETAQKKGYLLIVVTNQSGIAQGYYTESDFQVLTAYMRKQFELRGITITAVYHCPYHGDHPDRKPNPGLFIQAGEAYHLDFSASVAIGDKERDIEAAQRAHVGKTVLLSQSPGISKADHVVVSLAAAKEFL